MSKFYCITLYDLWIFNIFYDIEWSFLIINKLIDKCKYLNSTNIEKLFVTYCNNNYGLFIINKFYIIISLY